jgi:hypothetical protein
MYINLTDNEITDLLLADEWAGWSYQAASELAKHYNEIDWLGGTSSQLDVVAIRCEWSEYAELAEWAKEYYGPSCKMSNAEVRAELFTQAEYNYEGAETGFWDIAGVQCIEYEGGVLVNSGGNR